VALRVRAGQDDPAERDVASAAAAALCVAAGANIVRMHNARAAADAVRVADGVMAAAPDSGLGSVRLQTACEGLADEPMLERCKA
jgi:hypothetical protein